jgi:hypothetical protein
LLVENLANLGDFCANPFVIHKRVVSRATLCLGPKSLVQRQGLSFQVLFGRLALRIQAWNAKSAGRERFSADLRFGRRGRAKIGQNGRFGGKRAVSSCFADLQTAFPSLETASPSRPTEFPRPPRASAGLPAALASLPAGFPSRESAFAG